MNPIEKAVETAIGLKGNTRQKCAEIYNSYLPHPRGYKVKYDSDKMCAAYVSAIYISLGWTDIVPPECGAKQMFLNMQALDRAVVNRKYNPKAGDIIFFGGKTVDSIGHVGIVTEVIGKTIRYYDMNATVERHSVPVGNSSITGYGFPDYASKGDVPDEPSKDDKKDGTAFKPGDLVKIKPGSLWYKGQTIPASVADDQWYIISVKGDRAVLGMNLAETRNIQSPIHASDIELVDKTVTEEPPQEDKAVLQAQVKASTLEKLEKMAAEKGVTVGEILDGMVA